MADIDFTDVAADTDGEITITITMTTPASMEALGPLILRLTRELRPDELPETKRWTPRRSCAELGRLGLHDVIRTTTLSG